MFLETFGEKKPPETKSKDVLDILLEDAPAPIKETFVSALLFFSQANHPEKNITDEVKSHKLRDAFNLIFNYLVESKLNNLNEIQKIFLNTGAVADNIKIKDADVSLLRPDVYEKIKKQLTNISLPVWADPILTQVDAFRFLARGELLPLDLDRPQRSKKTQKEEEAENYKELSEKRGAEIKELREIITNLDQLVINFLNHTRIESTRDFKVKFDMLKTYFNLVSQTSLSSQQIQAKQDLEKRISGQGKEVSNFFEQIENVSSQIKTVVQAVDDRLGKIRELTQKLLSFEGKVIGGSKRQEYVFYDNEKIKLIKKDLSTTTSVIVKGSDTAPNRIPYSASRILLDAHTEKVEDPVEECYCTPQSLMKSFQKISKIHINLFQKDLSGNLALPPIIAVPGRNYLEWFDDRFIVSFVSGEQGRKGPNYSFSPVDVQVLKMFSLYLAKDPIYNYRGEQNVGTFMGDYAGKIEKKAAVKWAGEDKKMTMVSSSKVVDAAGREEAVKDYVELMYNLSNGLQPSQKLSLRKLSIILSYVVVINEENTVGLVLKYIAPTTPPAEVREIILSIAKKKKEEAKKLVEIIFQKDPQVSRYYQNDIKVCMDKVFGKDFF